MLTWLVALNPAVALPAPLQPVLDRPAREIPRPSTLARDPMLAREAVFTEWLFHGGLWA
jgi:hypothetical protein